MTSGAARPPLSARLRAVIVAVARRPSPARLKLLGALSMLVALGCWALASPVGAAPDEDYHLVSIWCAHGLQRGVCEAGATADSAAVPARLLRASCYRFHPETSASCQTEPPVPADMVITDRGNFSGDYPPLYYWVAGLFVGDDVGNSVIIMRLVNASLVVALIAAVYLLLPVGLRRPMVGGALVTAVPLGMFLIPSINPSGWALLSAATLLVCVLGYLTAEERRRRVALGALAAVSLLAGAGARADAAVYAVVAIGVAVILTVRHREGWAVQLRLLIYPAILTALAAAAFLSTGQSGAVNPNAVGDQQFSVGKLLRISLDIPALWIGGMGSPPPHEHNVPAWAWGLGWLDTTMPAVVWVGMWSVYAAILFVAIAGASLRRGFAVGAVALAVFALSTYMQFISSAPVGGLVQPRYILPLLIILAVTAMVRLDGAAFRLTDGQRWIVVGVLTIANAAAMYANLRRYVTGTDGATWNLDRSIEWWWSIPASPLTVWTVGVIAFGIGALLLTTEFTRTAAAADHTDRRSLIEDGSPDVLRAPSTDVDHAALAIVRAATTRL